ncbi:SDR family NAD(P)-dependent oxidoreductase [Streptomyces specialis]|uniref:SDR family NAD(P)-dependent oxidoreductase n=1 Tax=Streptomyces specialis TaxID=498367 RepID=UPI00073E981D|nr:SDR family NAD(P)-dependent oxidoreductase [Streptomyces specialis]
MTATPRTLAVFGAGPGLGRSVARRFGQEGFRVALVARTSSRLNALAADLAQEGIEAAGFSADLADLDALPDTIKAITSRFGPIDVLHYAPAGPDWLPRQIPIRDMDTEALDFPLGLLLRTPVTLIRHILPGMIERGRGAILFALTAAAGSPIPQIGNTAVAASAARAYLHNLHTDLAGTGVYAGLLQVGGMIGGSDTAAYVAERWDPATLPDPLDPADLAETCWNLYHHHNAFEALVTTPST